METFGAVKDLRQPFADVLNTRTEELFGRNMTEDTAIITKSIGLAYELALSHKRKFIETTQDITLCCQKCHRTFIWLGVRPADDTFTLQCRVKGCGKLSRFNQFMVVPAGRAIADQDEDDDDSDSDHGSADHDSENDSDDDDDDD